MRSELVKAKWHIRIKFEKRDAWIGVYWDYRATGFYYGVDVHKFVVYVCVVPFFPVVVWREAAYEGVARDAS